jgi:hypothetical protein
MCVAEGLWSFLRNHPSAPLSLAIAGTIGGAIANILLSGVLPLAGHSLRRLSLRNEPLLVRGAKERDSAAVASCFWFLLSIAVCYASYMGATSKVASAQSERVADWADTRAAFVRECVKSAKVTPTMSEWPVSYTLEFCGCAASKSVAKMTDRENVEIDSRGFLSAEQNQRLLIEPAAVCMSAMRSEHADLPPIRTNAEGANK